MCEVIWLLLNIGNFISPLLVEATDLNLVKESIELNSAVPQYL